MSRDFDLWELVQQVAEDPSLNTPQEISEVVLNRIPVSNLRDALSIALTGYVRNYLSQVRSGRPTTQELKNRVGGSNGGRSVKVASIRDTYKRMLDGRYHVGPGLWKTLRECTSQDVSAIAEERERMAKNNLKSAAKFRELLAKMESLRANRVEDLPDDVLQSVLTGEVE